jgi:Fur family ferric uptake transcriptional regulator
MKNVLDDIFKKSRLSITENRVRILTYFLESKKALSNADIEKLSVDAIDRVTVYRTLQTFMEKGIIHSIPSTESSVRYALCREACSEGHHHDNHVHFICDMCDTTYCLDKVAIPIIHLPDGFSASKTDMVISGFCRKCS